eukprot:TRINITY_DN4779_c0_g1_i1.p1 TRINITY_DN4779_c0_g1~~TRINITY_DN4779_c0_g1_i1.p1  ORF type:complete len:335 (-),score=87.34 TRINITY_DN4779_c0_g1_i1:104-1021(-)
MTTRVLVTNINPKAQEKDIASFFAFCGKVASLTVSKAWEGPADQSSVPAETPLKAVIQFESASSVDTAMLLNNAMLLDKPITVQKISAADPESAVPSEAASQSRAVQRKPSLLASLVASTYVAGVEAVDFVKTVDEKAKISESIKETTETINEKLEISVAARKAEESLQKAGAKLNEVGKEVDGRLKIGDNLNKINNELATAAHKTHDAIMQTAPMQSVVNFFRPFNQAITSSIEELKKDTKDAIAVKKAEYELKKAGTGSLADGSTAPPQTVSQDGATVSPDAESGAVVDESARSSDSALVGSL